MAKALLGVLVGSLGLKIKMSQRLHVLNFVVADWEAPSLLVYSQLLYKATTRHLSCAKKQDLTLARIQEDEQQGGGAVGTWTPSVG